MKISTQTQYAALVLLTLAQHHDCGPVTPGLIMTETGMSKTRIDTILLAFEHAGILEKVNADINEYRLRYHPNDISFNCIMKTAENGKTPQPCAVRDQSDCVDAEDCPARPIKRVTQIFLEEALESISLQDFMTQY